MLDPKRIVAIGRHVALIGATLLLLVMSVSSGRSVEGANRLTAQALRQSIGFGAPILLRRPAGAQTRASRPERSDTESERSSARSGAGTDLAVLHALLPSPQPTYRLLPPHTLLTVEWPRSLLMLEVERARAPPLADALRSSFASPSAGKSFGISYKKG